MDPIKLDDIETEERKQSIDPLRNLMAMTLFRAIDEYLGNSPRYMSKYKLSKKNAYLSVTRKNKRRLGKLYIWSNIERDDNLLSYLSCCEYLGLDPEKGRTGIKELDRSGIWKKINHRSDLIYKFFGIEFDDVDYEAGEE
jgi:hypothetical protein